MRLNGIVCEDSFAQIDTSNNLSRRLCSYLHHLLQQSHANADGKKVPEEEDERAAQWLRRLQMTVKRIAVRTCGKYLPASQRHSLVEEAHTHYLHSRGVTR